MKIQLEMNSVYSNVNDLRAEVWPFITVFYIVLAVLSFGAVPAATAESGQLLSLDTAVKAAQRNDPWLVRNRHEQDAVEAMSVAAAELPDPRMSVGLANFPTDTFDFGQEPMTQVMVGVTQMLPRGDSLDIKRRQLATTGAGYPFQRLDRRAKTTVAVSQLWLDVYDAQESIALIEEDRPLFQQLADIAEASYSTAVGKTRQQDIVRAQLELTRLEDRLTMLRQKQETNQEKLSGWLQGSFSEKYLDVTAAPQDELSDTLELSRQLPEIVMLEESLYTAPAKGDPEELYRLFADHPSVLAVEKNIEASKLAIDLARQKSKPMWGLNAGYGYRGDDDAGSDRADFITIGVSIDLPMFSRTRQDKEVQSALSRSEAVRTAKWSLIRAMIAGFEKDKAQLKRLRERQRLYRDQLLPQMHEQAEASLTAYTNDDGDFSEVVRARIAELNARIDALTIDVERVKATIRLNYFFMKNAEDIITLK